MMECTLCHTPQLDKIDEEFFSCPCCGGLMKDPALHPGQETEKEQYLLHNNDVNDPRYQHFTSPIWKFVKKHCSENEIGLDFGSGTGPVISKVLRDDGYRIKTYDPFFDPDGAALKDRYDYIVTCEVFEHFFNPAREIEMLKGLLKPGGRLIIMTLLYNDCIDFTNWAYRKDITHVFIYRKETFFYIVRNFGFSIEQMDDRLIVLKNQSYDL